MYPLKILVLSLWRSTYLSRATIPYFYTLIFIFLFLGTHLNLLKHLPLDMPPSSNHTLFIYEYNFQHNSFFMKICFPTHMHVHAQMRFFPLGRSTCLSSATKPYFSIFIFIYWFWYLFFLAHILICSNLDRSTYLSPATIPYLCVHSGTNNSFAQLWFSTHTLLCMYLPKIPFYFS